MFYGKNEIAEVNCAQDAQFALQVKEGAQLPVGGRLGMDQNFPFQDALGIRQMCFVPALSWGEVMWVWVGGPKVTCVLSFRTGSTPGWCVS